MLDHRDTQGCLPLPSSPSALGLDPPRWCRPLRSRNRSFPYVSQPRDASKCQACRAQVFLWKPISPEREVALDFASSRQALDTLSRQLSGSVLYYLAHLCSMCCQGYCPLPQGPCGTRRSCPCDIRAGLRKPLVHHLANSKYAESLPELQHLFPGRSEAAAQRV